MTIVEEYFNHVISWRQAKNELSSRVLAKGQHNDTWCRAEMFIDYWLDEHFESADDAGSALSSVFNRMAVADTRPEVMTSR